MHDMLSVPLREGYPFAFTADFEDGIDARYTAGIFQVRESADPLKPLIIGCDHTNGLTINYGAKEVAVSIPATATENLGATDRAKPVVGELRLHDPNNPGDRIGSKFQVFIDPTVIGNG